MPIPGLPSTRRATGARHSVSYRLQFFRGSVEIPGWALNISRGGLRAVVEDRVHVGEELDVRIADERSLRKAQVMWVQDEPDGTIIGVAFAQHLVELPDGVTTLDSMSEIAPPVAGAR